MMENIEFLCQAFDSIKLADINKQLNDLETDKQADFVVQTIDDHKQKETAGKSELIYNKRFTLSYLSKNLRKSSFICLNQFNSFPDSRIKFRSSSPARASIY